MKENLEKFILDQVKDLPILPDGWRYDFDFSREYDNESKSWNFVATAKPVPYVVCGDERFEIIEKAKVDIITHTNIESSPEEMAVLDSFLFRAWQMGWLDKYGA